MDSARHVIRCRLTQETRFQNAFDDVASALSVRPWLQVILNLSNCDLDGHVVAEVRDKDNEAGGLLRTSTRPTLNLLLLLRASVCVFTLKVSRAPISVRVLVLDDPPTRR